MGGDDRAVLYDAVGQIWLEFYGGHVHVGEYRDSSSSRLIGPKEQKSADLQTVQQVLQAPNSVYIGTCINGNLPGRAGRSHFRCQTAAPKTAAARRAVDCPLISVNHRPLCHTSQHIDHAINTTSCTVLCNCVARPPLPPAS